MGKMRLKNQIEPATPESGHVVVYPDSSDKHVKQKDDTGTVIDLTATGAHSLAGSEHNADTLENLNSKISDATLIDTNDSRLSDARTPTFHSHSAGDVTDFDTEVSNNTDVAANTAARHAVVTLGGETDDTTDDTLDLAGQEITVNLVTETTDGAMAANDKLKLNNMSANGSGDDWMTGLEVTAHTPSTDQTVDYSAGTYLINGIEAEISTGGTYDLQNGFEGVNHFTALAASQRRLVKIYVDSGEVIKSVAGAVVADTIVPVPPSIPIDSVCLASIYISKKSNGTVNKIENVDITDCRQGESSSTDEFAKVSGDDTTTGHLSDKLSDNGNVSFTIENPGAAETLKADVALGTESGTACEGNDSRLSDSRSCDNTFDNAATARTNLDTYNKGEVDSKVVGLYDHKGSYDADTNTPDLDSSPSGIQKADAYAVSVAGTFFTESVEVGDILISDQDDPTQLSHWTRVNKNISFGSSAGTACEGDDARLSDARTPIAHSNHTTSDVTDFDTEVSNNTDVATNTAKNSYPTADSTKLSGIAAGAQANRALASQGEAEAGTDNVKGMTPLRTKEAIAALGGSGGFGMQFSFGTTAGDFIEVAATDAYTKLDTFLFPGSSCCGTPTEIKGLLSSTLSGDLQWRIYDKTNSQTVAEGGASGDITVMAIYDFGIISNVPSDIAQWELQVKEVPTASGKSRCHALLIKF